MRLQEAKDLKRKATRIRTDSNDTISKGCRGIRGLFHRCSSRSRGASHRLSVHEVARALQPSFTADAVEFAVAVVAFVAVLAAAFAVRKAVKS